MGQVSSHDHVGLVVNNQGETSRFNWNIELYSSIVAGPASRVKGGMYTHQQARIQKHGLTSRTETELAVCRVVRILQTNTCGYRFTL